MKQRSKPNCLYALYIAVTMHVAVFSPREFTGYHNSSWIESLDSITSTIIHNQHTSIL